MSQNPNDYRPGDKVVIAPEEYLKSKGIEFNDLFFTPGTDRVVELIEYSSDTNGWIVCKERDGVRVSAWFHEAAILGHAFKWGEKIKVITCFDPFCSMDDKFLYYGVGARLPICTQSGTYSYARPIRKEEEKPQEPEVFWGELVENGCYTTPPTGKLRAHKIAELFHDDKEWEFHGFWDTKCEVAGYSNGRWHAEILVPRGVVKLAPFAKFVRREKK